MVKKVLYFEKPRIIETEANDIAIVKTEPFKAIFISENEPCPERSINMERQYFGVNRFMFKVSGKLTPFYAAGDSEFFEMASRALSKTQNELLMLKNDIEALKQMNIGLKIIDTKVHFLKEENKVLRYELSLVLNRSIWGFIKHKFDCWKEKRRAKA